jgi:hypothetical protein
VKNVAGKKELRLLNILDIATKLKITGSGDLFNPMFVTNNDNLIFNEYSNDNIALKGVPISTTSPTAIGIGGNISAATGVSGKPGLLTIEDVENPAVQPQTGNVSIEISPDMSNIIQVVSVNEGEQITISFTLTEKPDDYVYVKIKELNNDQFFVEGSYLGTTWNMVYPIQNFDSSNYTIPKSFTLTNIDDSKKRGTIIGNIIFEIETHGTIYDSVDNQIIELQAIDND